VPVRVLVVAVVYVQTVGRRWLRFHGDRLHLRPGRRQNAQLDVYLELMHTASLRCLAGDLAGPQCPTELPHASRSDYASRRSLADALLSCPISVSRRVLAPGSWREAAAAAAVAVV